jgi:hypothetical protein
VLGAEADRAGGGGQLRDAVRTERREGKAIPQYLKLQFPPGVWVGAL